MTDLVLQAKTMRVLELWFGRRHSTDAIARLTGLDEADVCWIIEDSQGRSRKVRL